MCCCLWHLSEAELDCFVEGKCHAVGFVKGVSILVLINEGQVIQGKCTLLQISKAIVVLEQSHRRSNR